MELLLLLPALLEDPDPDPLADEAFLSVVKAVVFGLDVVLLASPFSTVAAARALLLLLLLPPLLLLLLPLLPPAALELDAVVTTVFVAGVVLTDVGRPLLALVLGPT